MKTIPLILLLSFSLTFAFSHNTYANEQEQVIREVKTLLQGIPGVEIRPVADMLFIEGTVDDPRSVAKIAEITESLSGIMKSLVKLSDKGKEKVAEDLAKEIGTPGISVRFLNNALFLGGIAANDFEADRAVEIARTYLTQFIAWTVTPTQSGDRKNTRSPAATGKNATQIEGVTMNAAFGTGATIVDMMRIRPRIMPKKIN